MADFITKQTVLFDAFFANIFLCFHETIWLEDCPKYYKPVLYKRYVDDTFIAFQTEISYSIIFALFE